MFSYNPQKLRLLALFSFICNKNHLEHQQNAVAERDNERKNNLGLLSNQFSLTKLPFEIV